MSVKTLEDEILAGRHEISADNISMSISELTSLFSEGTLIIRPEFQRLFRWGPEQKSRLIESIILGIPIPSIFVAQDEEGRWELVDGLQRVSTLLELQGLLPDEGGDGRPELKLSGTQYLRQLEGKSWSGADPLSQAQKRDIRLSRLDIRVIKRDSDSTAKYDLFQRLNSYGSKLTPQEIRNAFIAGESSSALGWLNELAHYPNFKSCLALSDRQGKEQYDVELLLRFLMLHNWKLVGKRGGLGEFSTKLDNWVMNLAENFEGPEVGLEDAFKGTFDYISEHADENVFRKWDPDAGVFRDGFLNTSFEVIALGVGYLIANDLPVRRDVLEVSREVWPAVKNDFGSVTGLATGDRLAKTIPLGRALMAPRNV